MKINKEYFLDEFISSRLRSLSHVHTKGTAFLFQILYISSIMKSI